jgi:hypothetical protein
VSGSAHRVGFSEPAYGVWYILDFFVDIYFWIDLVLNFFTVGLSMQ